MYAEAKFKRPAPTSGEASPVVASRAARTAEGSAVRQKDHPNLLQGSTKSIVGEIAACAESFSARTCAWRSGRSLRRRRRAVVV